MFPAAHRPHRRAARWTAVLVAVAALVAAVPAQAQAPEVAPSRVPVFEQGVGVSLAERPTFLDAERNIRPGSISGRDAWSSLTWDSWGGATATGSGNYAWNAPDGSGPQMFPVRISLDESAWCGTTRVYTRITGTFTGTPPADLSPTISHAVLPYECPPESAGGGGDADDTLVGTCSSAIVYRGRGVKYRATEIQRSTTISCKLARDLLRAAYKQGPLKITKTKHHGPNKSGRPTYYVKGGWRCSNGAGGASCTSTKSRHNNVVLDGTELRFAVMANVGLG